MLMKETITRETHFPLNPKKARQHHENSLFSFPYETIVLTLVENAILANKGHRIKDDVVFWGSA